MSQAEIVLTVFLDRCPNIGDRTPLSPRKPDSDLGQHWSHFWPLDEVIRTIFHQIQFLPQRARGELAEN